MKKYYVPKRLATLCATLGLSLSLSGCGSDAETFTGNYKPFQGIWQSPAYGQTIRIVGDTLLTYQHTYDHCVLATTESNVNSQTMNNRFHVDSNKLVAYKYPALKHVDDAAIVYEKISSLPHSCATQITSLIGDKDYQRDPERDAKIFIDTFNELYVDFTLSKTDWTAIEQDVLNRVHATTTDEQLMTVLSDAIAPLQNGHVGIYNGQSTVRYKHPEKPDLLTRLSQEFMIENEITPPLSPTQREQRDKFVLAASSQIEKIIASYSNDPASIQRAANDNLIWFKHGDIGYLNIAELSDFNLSQDLPQQLKVLQDSLAQVITDMEETRALIIDLRFNGGGYPFMAKTIAQHFTSEPVIAYTEQVREGSSFTVSEEIVLSPQTPLYEMPVAVLISNTTASAAELLALSLKALPQVTLIGEPTQGMLSGSFNRHLPNGFVFGVSNLKRLANQGEWYEHIGIPVDIAAQFFTPELRASERDAGLDAAFDLFGAN